MPGPASANAARLLAVLAACWIGLSPAGAERIPFGPIPFGPIAPYLDAARHVWRHHGDHDRVPHRRASRARSAAKPDATKPDATKPEPVTPGVAVPASPVAPGRLTIAMRNAPMNVRIVRDLRPGCGAHCAEWIAAEGQIAPGTGAAFARVMREMGTRRLPVLIDSGGGAVRDALAMGRMIRERKLDVAVTQTIPGTAAEALARSPGSVCASACILVLAAGNRRLGGIAAHLGVHQMSVHGVRTVKKRIFRIYYRWIGGVKREVGRRLVSEKVISATPFVAPASLATDEQVARYLDDMGIGPGLMPMMLSTPPSKIRWLTPNEEKSTALLTAAGTGEALVAEAETGGVPAPGAAARVASAAAAPRPATGTLHWQNVDGKGTSDGAVAWRLATVPGKPPALMADIAVPAAGMVMTLHVAPRSSDAGAVAIDATVETAGADHSIDEIFALEPLGGESRAALTGPPATIATHTWRLMMKGGVHSLAVAAPGKLALPVLADGSLHMLTFDPVPTLAPLLAAAEKAWAEDARPKAASR